MVGGGKVRGRRDGKPRTTVVWTLGWPAWPARVFWALSVSLLRPSLSDVVGKVTGVRGRQIGSLLSPGLPSDPMGMRRVPAP